MLGARDGSSGWSKTDTGYDTLGDWLHADNDEHYQERRRVADAATKRAEELAAVQYPVSAREQVDRDLGPFLEEGRQRMKRTGSDGETTGSFFAVVRKIQQQILSSEIAKADGRTPDIRDVRCAGEEEIPCPKTAAGYRPPPRYARNPNLW